MNQFQALLIIPKISKSSADSDGSTKQNRIYLFLRGLVVKPLFIVLFFFFLSALPTPASAGVFSFLGNIFGFNKVSYSSENNENLQSMNLLRAALNDDPIPVKGGGDITIVNGSALLSDTGLYGSIVDINENKNSSDQISLYVVREGDNLSQIANMFGVSVNTIVWSNDNIKRGDLITPGQTIVILPVTGVQYTIKKGDTLASITKELKGDIEEIIEFNGLTEGEPLAVGEVIMVPNGELKIPVYSYTSVRGTNVPSYSGYYIRPINGGRRSQGLHGYNGIDIAAPIGTPIMAAASGDVIISDSYGWNAGYGKYIVIRHPNGTQTLYAHNSENIVSAGWHVIQGQIIGYVGSTGKSTGPHVHFEVRGAQNPW